MKLIFNKFRSSRITSGNSQNELREHSIATKRSLNQEYREAFRTKSYDEMCTKVQSQMERPSIHSNCMAQSLLEPSQGTLIDMMKTLDFHRLLIDYFQASSDACNACELVLRAVRQTRVDYRRIWRAIKLTETSALDGAERCKLVCRELAAFASLRNPLSAVIAQVEFCDMRNAHVALLRALTRKHKKLRRRNKLVRACKRIGGYGLIILSGATATAAIVLAIHGTFGTVLVVPGLLASCSCFGGCCELKTAKWTWPGSPDEKSSRGTVCTQFDVAAKGMYILINDMDTVSRLVGGLHDEVEHCKARAEIVVRSTRIRNCGANYNKKGGDEVMTEVVKEFEAHSGWFMEELEELEEHINLCLLTMNRSRRVVFEEILITDQIHRRHSRQRHT